MRREEINDVKDKHKQKMSAEREKRYSDRKSATQNRSLAE